MARSEVVLASPSWPGKSAKRVFALDVPAIQVFVAGLSGRQRMMFVHDAPFAINFAQTHRQPEFERFRLAVGIDVDAPSCCRSEGDIRT